MTGLNLQNVGKSFGTVRVLRDIDLSIEKGEFLVLLGGSGCGKSTLLRLISGLELEHEGAIEIGGRDRSDGFRPSMKTCNQANFWYRITDANGVLGGRFGVAPRPVGTTVFVRDIRVGVPLP